MMTGRHGATVLLVLAGLMPALPVDALELRGRLDWHERVALGVPLSGVVHAVTAETGQRVARGELLLRLDPRPFTLQLRAAGAEVESRKLARDEARRELERARELYERTLLSDHDLKLASIALETAEAEHRLAVTALQRARLDKTYSELRAPFDAIVVERRAVVGQTVVASMQAPVLFIVADATRMRVRVPVDGDRLAGLAAGTEVRIRVAGASYTGRLLYVSPEPVERGGDDAPPRYEAVFVFAVGEAVLRPGQQAEVELP